MLFCTLHGCACPCGVCTGCACPCHALDGVSTELVRGVLVSMGVKRVGATRNETFHVVSHSAKRGAIVRKCLKLSAPILAVKAKLAAKQVTPSRVTIDKATRMLTGTKATKATMDAKTKATKTPKATVKVATKAKAKAKPAKATAGSAASGSKAVKAKAKAKKVPPKKKKKPESDSETSDSESDSETSDSEIESSGSESDSSCGDA